MKKIEGIRNLLFDLGGVIMNLKRENAVEALKKLGMTDANDFLGEYGQKGPFLALEKGEVTTDEFRYMVRHHIGNVNLSDEELDAAFNAFLDGIPAYRLSALRELRNLYKVYLLSNTNEIMWNSRIREEFEKEGFSIECYFDGIVTSFEAHLYKPEAAIFCRVADVYGLRPEETLFLDDSLDNVRAAEALGFRCLHVAPGNEFMNFFC